MPAGDGEDGLAVIFTKQSGPPIDIQRWGHNLRDVTGFDADIDADIDAAIDAAMVAVARFVRAVATNPSDLAEC
ncbi:hypothetical protein ACIBEH_32830 [Nocardia salmonicida]|uniref:hypothetical protein n=1 Tax=Nocardia salmonicida TaxID=53431 RepID=UPI0037A15D90